FIGAEGRCTETAFLEFHHIEPYAVGGASTLENIALRCRAHNGYEARVFFGAEWAREAPGTWGDAQAG
ncbi:MAG TPA: HNH endonuclease, partial [Vicinamibacterales bacterium]|nr:HNH endonuclease [Vicinamibacterales bacterium]